MALASMGEAAWGAFGGIATAIIVGILSLLGKRQEGQNSRKAVPLEVLSNEFVELRAEQADQRRQLNLVVTDRDNLVLYVYRLYGWAERVQSGEAPPPMAPLIPIHLRDAFRAAGVPWPSADATVDRGKGNYD